jgi:hypothetical protein
VFDQAGAAGLGGVQVGGGVPEVLQDVDEVDDDRDLDAAVAGFGGDALELVVVAVDQGDPAAPVLAGRGAGRGRTGGWS